MKNELPIKAQVLVYKVVNNKPLVLCLKRSKADGGFWHVLTGTMENDENLIDCIKREIKEETCLSQVVDISFELKRYVWVKNDLPIWVIEFAVKVSDKETVILNQENDEFKWLSPKEAKSLVEKDSAKELVDLFINFIKLKKEDYYSKVSREYLDGISSNLDEKVGFILDQVKKNKLPLINKKVELLEIGIGGGQTIAELKNKTNKKINITAIDIYPELVAVGSRLQVQSHVANVCNLPFKDNSFSCVNASSILHEVSSYGFESKGASIYGLKAVKVALNEIKRVLHPGGVFFYRDVLMPEKNDIKEVLYKPKSWRLFIDYFLQDFSVSGPAFYKNNIKLKKRNEYYSVLGKSGLHREIQKHYLLWITYLKNSYLKEFSLNNDRKNLVKENLFVENCISDIIDREGIFLDKIKENLHEWLKREGREHYVYLSIKQIVDFCLKDIDNESMVLFPEHTEDVIKITRKADNKYLEAVIREPETEGKQVIHFKKIHIDKVDSKILNNLNYERNPKIISIAFEGMHRTGKGTQIEMLKKRFSEIDIPFVDIRGEGSRTGGGKTTSDPKSDYWVRLNEELHNEGVDNQNLWDEASYRLAREFLVWRDRVLKNKIENSLAPFGILIIDRSLISNASLKSHRNKPEVGQIFTSEELYRTDIQKKKKITPRDVLPDIIIELIAPKDVLISRLEKTDPKYEFRRRNIEEKYDVYVDAKLHLEKEIADRIVSIDSSMPPEKVFEGIEAALKERFPDLTF